MHLIEEQCSDHPLFRWYDVGDLMVMGAERRDGHPLLYLYKHRLTRHYMHIDADGVAWRYVAPPRYDPDDDGTYEPLPSLSDALVELRLWEVPMMRNAPFNEVRQAFEAALGCGAIIDDDDDDEYQDESWLDGW